MSVSTISGSTVVTVVSMGGAGSVVTVVVGSSESNATMSGSLVTPLSPPPKTTKPTPASTRTATAAPTRRPAFDFLPSSALEPIATPVSAALEPSTRAVAETTATTSSITGALRGAVLTGNGVFSARVAASVSSVRRRSGSPAITPKTTALMVSRSSLALPSDTPSASATPDTRAGMVEPKINELTLWPSEASSRPKSPSGRARSTQERPRAVTKRSFTLAGDSAALIIASMTTGARRACSSAALLAEPT